MKRPVTVRGLTLGEGLPKICVPIVAKNMNALVEYVGAIKKSTYDLIEWRIDWFDDYEDEAAVREAAAYISRELQCPVLFTFRTKAEGGEKTISAAAYEKLLLTTAKTGLIDLVDVELFFESFDFVEALIEKLHDAGVKVVGSNHSFHHTPNDEVLIRRLTRMEMIGCDIAKIAVMPESVIDTARLLYVTAVADQKLFCPVITMAMSRTGVISRIAGEVFGSCLTFGAVGQVSAPGQIESGKLREVMEVLHENL